MTNVQHKLYELYKRKEDVYISKHYINFTRREKYSLRKQLTLVKCEKQLEQINAEIKIWKTLL